MTISEFFSDRLSRIILQAACILATAALLLLTGTQSGIIALLLITWLFIFLILQIFDYYKTRTRLEALSSIMDGLDEKYLFFECIPRAENIYEQKLFDLLRISAKSMIGAVSDARAAGQEYREYVERWVHEIKTPITAAQLICRNAGAETGHPAAKGQNIPGEIRRKLSCELSQIDAHVERALFYARAESPEKDFLIRQANLAEIAAEAIRAHQALLIQSGVRIETTGLEKTVYTDSKWVVFMLGQLLQNAARYRSDTPLVTLSADYAEHALSGDGTARIRYVQLTVSDKGIGVPAHELPRVFDRGFTGSNGRRLGGSTGMGLYLCKKLADALEIGLTASSQEGKGFCITMTFPAKEKLTKM